MSIETIGIHHVGLTVRSLELSLAFFMKCLGWEKKGEQPDYPAAFVTDGRCFVTLWQIKADKPIVEFDRFSNIGLHHLAFKVTDEAQLASVFARVASWPGVITEFAPDQNKHFMIIEPGGTRIEFACAAADE